ncbi:MAG: hypothetical protein J5784_01185 [Muribaculaceae bacterium]|nr:hypothetical protein [Muribaculaceae bacterium]MBR5437137.1 hypothetical protein [Muribaculaceae bacterium]MBR5745608.1 hypothetical protein [Muribaculaceae bacterium]
MQENLQINIQFSRDQVATVATLANAKLDEETWDILTDEPISVSIDDIDDGEAKLGLLFALVGLALAKKL